MKPLPIGNATFRDIIEGENLYIDKTRYLHQLVSQYKGLYFLSRPRRFGKSLMVSTLEEIFRGSKDLFKGLWIHEESDYDWESYPIIRLDMSGNQISSTEELNLFLDFIIQVVAHQYDIALAGYDPNSRFGDLIQQLGERGRVVILIDEYDKPILDNIKNIDEAEKIRGILKGFYGVIKPMDAYLRFVFVTGISKFSKVSVFSDLNNLEEMTMRTSMGAALGLTEDEIRSNMSEYIRDFARQEGLTDDALMDKVRYWYNGFCFAPEAENVYNPFSTLLLFQSKRFTSHWFETATPTFLINLIHQGDYDVAEFEDLLVREFAFATYDIKRLAIIPLLFQTGYLTIKDYEKETQFYTLSYPNYEVKHAFLIYLLDAFSYVEQGLSAGHLRRLINALQKNDLDEFFERLKVLYANIDYDLHVDQERYYQTIFYLVFKLMGLQIDAEVKTNRGRIDAVVQLADHIYIFEFKLGRTSTVALDQIGEKEYYQKYRLGGKAITQVGANFDREKRNITDWQSAETE